jgi:cell wall-associated NlpC family hydrolase
MIFKRLFPCALVAALALSLFAISAIAQNQTLRPRQVSTVTDADGVSRLETDPVIIYEAPEERSPARLPLTSTRPNGLLRFDQLLSAAIDTRLGARYVWGASGPYVFDCSGFVWSSFQSVGINFERASARTLWARFAPARAEEELKFGTLVFFNNQTHVGIVADEHGFYHASRSKGVIYSSFDGYWGSRIDGFRRVPMPPQMVAD